MKTSPQKVVKVLKGYMYEGFIKHGWQNNMYGRTPSRDSAAFVYRDAVKGYGFAPVIIKLAPTSPIKHKQEDWKKKVPTSKVGPAAERFAKSFVAVKHKRK